jgi:hypothetical protein
VLQTPQNLPAATAGLGEAGHGKAMSPPDWGSTTRGLDAMFGAIVACSPTIGLPGL